MSRTKSTWYLDSCASRHLTNDRSLFIGKILPKAWDFTTAGGQIIQFEGVGTVHISLADGSNIELEGIALVLQCKSNLISLGQLRDNRITYHDNSSSMLLMQDGVPIAHAKRDRNLFILDLAAARKVMQVNTQAMITTRQGRPMYLVSRVKKVCIWHRRFGHVSNTRVIWVSKLLTEMGDFSENYDPVEIYSDFKASELEESLDSPDLINNDSTNADTAIETQHGRLMKASKITDSDFDEIYEPYMESKQTRVVRRYKPMIPAEEKLEEVHVDLWWSHDLPSLSGSVYAAILICEKTRKSWVLYLRSKDKFVDTFQNWLPKIEIESGQLMKTLRIDRGREFISIKLKGFCDKKSIALKYATPYRHEENGLAEKS